MAYVIELTSEDWKAIEWTGHRYGWSESLIEHTQTGANEIPEHIAWEIREAMESDTEGGDSYFPCLNPKSDLYEKLITFIDSIV